MVFTFQSRKLADEEGRRLPGGEVNGQPLDEVLHVQGAGTTLVNVLLPAVHPRMGTPSSAADSSPLLEAPGFMLLDYGQATPALTILAHLACGAIVGAFVAGSAR